MLGSSESPDDIIVSSDIVKTDSNLYHRNYNPDTPRPDSVHCPPHYSVFGELPLKLNVSPNSPGGLKRLSRIPTSPLRLVHHRIYICNWGLENVVRESEAPQRRFRSYKPSLVTDFDYLWYSFPIDDHLDNDRWIRFRTGMVKTSDFSKWFNRERPPWLFHGILRNHLPSSYPFT